jgi:predicted transposase YbfD/YdcC
MTFTEAELQLGKVTEKFKVSNINDLELLYSILRERYPSNEIGIQFNWNTKEYTINVTDKTYCFDPEVPVDLGIQVVYGDSVTGDTPLLLKKDNMVYIETIQSIFDIDKKKEYPGFKMFDKTIRLEKEFSTTDYQIWTDIGWVDIKKVIRHRCDKKIYRVLTHTGCIDVTEDHSLIRDTLEPIKPKDLKIGDSLLHSFPSEFIENKETIVKMKMGIEKTKQNDVEYNKNEQWIKLKDYNNYSVSSFGNIKNNITNKLMKPKINNGYYIINIKSNDNKYINVPIHRLVAIMFLDNNENKHTVNHKNHNKLDNNLHNLEWFTMNEQNIHKRKRENTPGRKVLQYDLNMNYIQSFNTVREAGRSINKEQYSTMISKVCKGTLESYMNFIWKYDQENILKNEEIWKELTYNKHIFNVSNYGRVKNKYGYSYGSLTDSGYLRTSSCFNKQIMKKFVHVLVAEAFISKINDNLIVNHKDGNKSNNNVNNLEWVTFSENAKHSHNIKKEIVEYILTEKEAEVWGFFMNYGKLIDTYYKCNVRKCYWYICNNNLERLNYFKDILESVEPIKFKILDTLKSSGVYKLVPTGSLKYMVDKYRKLFYYQQDCNGEGDKYKIVPNCILNASKEIKMAYWKGYYEADGAKTNGNSINKPRFAVKGKIGAQCMYYLMKSIGFDMYINLANHPKKQEMYFLDLIKNVKRDSTLVKKIVDRGTTNDYVYDIETDIGRFACGVGQLNGFNTDSIFIKFKYNRDDFERNRRDTFRLATVCGDNLTKDIFNRKPIELEFEKVFHPFILLTKKRYIANKFENTKDPFDLKGVDAKGIALTRRDYCPMVKKCYKKVIDTILEDTNKKSDLHISRDLARQGDLSTKSKEDPVVSSTKVYLEYIDNIFNYKIPIDDLIVSAMLAASYKKRPVHVQLAEKLKKRKEEVQIGDRIPYIYIETDDPKKQKSELGEDPNYAKKHNLKYNRSCYLEQLAKPILGFYKVVLKDYPSLLDHVIDYTNNKIVSCGGKKLSPSDFKIEE